MKIKKPGKPSMSSSRLRVPKASQLDLPRKRSKKRPPDPVSAVKRGTGQATRAATRPPPLPSTAPEPAAGGGVSWSIVALIGLGCICAGLLIGLLLGKGLGGTPDLAYLEVGPNSGLPPARPLTWPNTGAAEYRTMSQMGNYYPLAVPYMYLHSCFGKRHHPIQGKPMMHRGVDLGGAEDLGRPVLAVADGVVGEIGDEKGLGGLYIHLWHADGYLTKYLHLQQFLVQAGEPVRAGQPIATMGSTGGSTGPHLHFEIWRGDQPYDPQRYLRAHFPWLTYDLDDGNCRGK